MLRWVFGADTKPFQAGLAQMRTQTSAFSASVGRMIAGAFGVGAIISGFSRLASGMVDFMQEMARIDDLSKRFGENAETLQRVGNTAELAGSDLENVAKAMTKVTQNAVKAAGGSKEMSKAFAGLGINAAEFADLPMDQKLVALATAYEASGSSAQGLANMMAILGKSGADIIPMLTEGPEKLTQQLKDAKVVAQSVVTQMAALDDVWVSTKQGLKASLGDQILKLQLAYSLLKNKGDLLQTTRDVFGGKEPPAKPKTNELDEDSEKEKEKLAEEIEKLKEESRQRQLSLAEKILDAEKRIADLAFESRYGPGDDNDRLEATKKILEAQKELDGLQKEQSQKTERENADAFKEVAEKQKRIDDLAAAEAEDERNRKFGKLDEAGKIKMLSEERDALNQQSKLLGQVDPFTGEKADEEGSIQARIDAKKKQDEIDGMGKRETREAPAIMAEDIRRAGGGGFASMKTIDPAREALSKYDTMIQKLDSIDRKTKAGTNNIPPPI